MNLAKAGERLRWTSSTPQVDAAQIEARKIEVGLVDAGLVEAGQPWAWGLFP
jgi:hypothetical protein